jgi:acyl-CoA dehydrogenase
MSDDLFELPDVYRNLQIEARALANSVSDIAWEADDSSEVHLEMRSRLAASGLARVMIPGEYGGRFEKVDPLAIAIIREQLAGESGHLDSLFAMQGIGSYAIGIGGSTDACSKYLSRVGAMTALAALALTEPDVGSDLKSLTTTLEFIDGRLVLNGHKSFITNAGDADFYCVLAREGDGFSLVLVPADAKGLSTTRPHQIIAPHVLGDVVFSDVEVPEENRLGAPGDGFTLVLATLATFRVSVAGAAVGVASAALREAVHHAAGRRQFGVPLARLGSVPAALASSWVDIEMARSLTYRAAAAAARDPLANLDLSSIAKVGATEAAGRVTDRCVQVMGRFGLVRGSKIERLYREARPMRIYEGATEVIYDSLAKRLVKEITT